MIFFVIMEKKNDETLKIISAKPPFEAVFVTDSS